MRSSLSIVALLAFCFTITSCEAIGGIFKAGAWFGVIAVVIIIAVVLWLIGKAKK